MTPSTAWKEVVSADEPAHLEHLAERVRAMQRSHARGGPASRGLHAKPQAGLEAEFTVLPDVPEYARVGLFASPATYRAYVRFSNGVGARRSDRKPDVRGVAIKVVGVDGTKLIPGLESARTQDFLLIRSPAQPFSQAEEFVSFLEAASNEALLLPRLLWRFGPARGLRIIRALLRSLSVPMVSVATTPYFSALPIRFGPYAVKYALAPHAASEPGAKPGQSRDYLGEELAQRLEAGPVTYDFQVQFFVDEATTPIEDASKEWEASAAPFVTLARLTLPRQQLSSARARQVAEFVERLSFDPWHAPVEFRPLGQMMRARNVAYRLSTQERGVAPEPDGTERFEEAAGLRATG